MNNREADELAVKVYPSSLHADVIAELNKYWMKARPWTEIRELRKGVDDPSGHHCIGVMGQFDKGCSKPVAGVQYTTAFGDPVFYCEDHALEQFKWDKANYDEAPKERPDPGPEWHAEIAKMMFKIEKKKRKKEEPEEIDPS